MPALSPRLPFLCRWALELLSVSLLAAFAQKSMISPLAQWHDRARPLLLFAPSAQDPRFIEQLRLLDEHAAEVHDRDLVVLPLVLQGDDTTTGDGNAAPLFRRRNQPPSAGSFM